MIVLQQIVFLKAELIIHLIETLICILLYFTKFELAYLKSDPVKMIKRGINVFQACFRLKCNEIQLLFYKRIY